MNKRIVSVVIPTYNEEDNIVPVTQAVIEEISVNLPEYDYEILIIDNASQDNTRNLIRDLCKKNIKIKAIFNEKNYGPDSSPYYGLLQSKGDCSILFCADFQDPVDMIHKLVREWEKGYTLVTAIKTESKENKIMRFLRTMYYRLMKKISNTEIIEHFTGFGCYDRSFIKILKDIDDPVPFLRGAVAEFASNKSSIEYVQQKRRAGKSHIRFFTLYDIMMRSFTSYTKVGLRMASFLGYIIAILSFIVALVYFVLKCIFWYEFDFGVPVILIGMFFLGAVQMIFLGFIGEYILVINQRIMHRPLVIEHERLNFDIEDDYERNQK